MILKEIIEGMIKRPGMFVSEPHFSNMCSFLNGYDFANDGGVLVGFREWLVTTLEYGDNFTWDGLINHYILINFPEFTEKDKVEKLGTFILNFLEEKEKYRGLKLIYINYELWLRAQSWYNENNPDYINLEI